EPAQPSSHRAVRRRTRGQRPVRVSGPHVLRPPRVRSGGGVRARHPPAARGHLGAGGGGGGDLAPVHQSDHRCPVAVAPAPGHTSAAPTGGAPPTTDKEQSTVNRLPSTAGLAAGAPAGGWRRAMLGAS